VKRKKPTKSQSSPLRRPPRKSHQSQNSKNVTDVAQRLLGCVTFAKTRRAALTTTTMAVAVTNATNKLYFIY